MVSVEAKTHLCLSVPRPACAKANLMLQLRLDRSQLTRCSEGNQVSSSTLKKTLTVRVRGKMLMLHYMSHLSQQLMMVFIKD